MYRIGIDLGGTNIAAGLVDNEMVILDRLEIPTRAPRPIEEIVQDMADMVRTLFSRNGVEKEQLLSVGVGVPCTANEKNGHMEDANNLGYEDTPFVSLLEEALGVPVFFGNDANVAAWGEYLAGGYTGSFLMVTIGTGIGGGIILDGKLWSGVNGAAGEFGHMTIPGDGAQCTCGRKGCFEACASATALIRQAKERMGQDDRTLLWVLCGGNADRVEAKTVFDGAAAGDAACIQLLDTYTGCLAEGLANIINMFQPEWLCIGGGVSRAGEALLAPVREKTAGLVYSQNAKKNTQIVLARLHNDAGILGAALLEHKRRERL